MTEDELKEWFFDKMNSCYPVKLKDDSSIYWYYDERFTRSVKINKLNNTDAKLPSEVKGVCLFQIDLMNKYFWCDYHRIWRTIEKEYNEDFDIIAGVLRKYLVEYKILHFKPYTKTITFNVFNHDFANLSVDVDSFGGLLDVLRNEELNI